MLGSCLVCGVSDIELSDVGTRRGGCGGKKLSSKIFGNEIAVKRDVESDEYVTTEKLYIDIKQDL